MTIVSFHEQILGWNVYLARAKDSSGTVAPVTASSRESWVTLCSKRPFSMRRRGTEP